MPYTLTSQNFDGVTAPSLPAGWTFGSDYDTDTTVSVSGANSLRRTATAGSRQTGIFNTAETVGGNVQVFASFRFAGVTGGNTCQWGTVARYVDANNYYYVGIEVQNSVTPGVSLYKAVAGVHSQLGSTVGGALTILANNWYDVTLECNGNLLRVYCRRASTGNYLSSGGTFSAGRKACIEIADNSLTAAGKYGVQSFQTAAETNAQYADDFLAESLTDLGGMWWDGSFDRPPSMRYMRPTAYRMGQTLATSRLIHMEENPEILNIWNIDTQLPVRRDRRPIRTDRARVEVEHDFTDFDPRDIPDDPNDGRDPTALLSSGRFILLYGSRKLSVPVGSTPDVWKDILDPTQPFGQSVRPIRRTTCKDAMQVGVGDVQKELFNVDLITTSKADKPSRIPRQHNRGGDTSMQRREIPNAVIDTPLPDGGSTFKVRSQRTVLPGEMKSGHNQQDTENVPYGWDTDVAVVPNCQRRIRATTSDVPWSSDQYYGFNFSWFEPWADQVKHERPVRTGQVAFTGLVPQEQGLVIDWNTSHAQPVRRAGVTQTDMMPIAAVAYPGPLAESLLAWPQAPQVPIRQRTIQTGETVGVVKVDADLLTDPALFVAQMNQDGRPTYYRPMQPFLVQQPPWGGMGYSIIVSGPFYTEAGQMFVAGAEAGQVRSGG